MDNDAGRVPLAPGSREPDPQAVPALTGFDPSREIEERFWSIVDRDGLSVVPSDMWDALELIVRRSGHYDGLVRALHDAICSPKGVVPESAERYYRSYLCIGRG